MSKEIYKVVVDYPNYAVSNLGNIKNLTTGIVIKGHLKDNKYLTVRLIKEKALKIHRLVAIAFVPNPQNKPQVNHINAIKTDNRAVNLEWVNNRENVCHIAKKKETTSKYIGVHYRSYSNRFIATINIKNKTKYIGSFEKEIDAYNARVEFEKKNNIINKYL